jgi:hypothetical protein
LVSTIGLYNNGFYNHWTVFGSDGHRSLNVLIGSCLFACGDGSILWQKGRLRFKEFAEVPAQTTRTMIYFIEGETKKTSFHDTIQVVDNVGSSIYTLTRTFAASIRIEIIYVNKHIAVVECGYNFR